MKHSFIFCVGIFLLVSTGILVVQSCGNNTNTDTKTGAGEFQFKEKLSEYGFFKNNLKDLDPQPGVFHYSLHTPLFTDYAIKDRFIVLPKGKSIQFAVEGVPAFPDSSIIIKNFAYTNTDHKKIMIETRLLVKDPFDKKWKVMDYLWNAEQTDAKKHITGARVPITLLDDDGNKIFTNYQVPNTNDCKRCHINNDVFTPIGPKARNLNFVVDGHTENQLTEMTNLGMFAGLPDVKTIAVLPDWKDAKNFTLDQRARAYLDVNCAHCHTQGGDAYNTGLFLEYQQTDPPHIGIMKQPVSAGGGAGGLNYDIIPGDTTHSILLYRMNSAEPGTAMPELARTVIHKEGVQLIKEWISKMPAQKK